MTHAQEEPPVTSATLPAIVMPFMLLVRSNHGRWACDLIEPSDTHDL
jgi:hypothetical protein